MAASRLNRITSDSSGYAATTVLLTVAALSIIAAAGLNLSHAQDRCAKQLFKEALRDEILNEALMRFAGRLQTNSAPDVVADMIVVDEQTLSLRGEHEAMKWRIDKVDLLTTAAFNSKAKGLTLDEARAMITNEKGSGGLDMVANDCLRRLFSPFGQASTDAVITGKSVAALTTNTSKEGQVWRLRAVMGTHGRELYVRFIGRSDQLYAVIAEENFNAKEVPACAG